MIVNGNEFAKVQINFTTERTPEGKILRISEMVNIRENSVSKAVSMYRELKQKLENGKESHEKKGRKTKTVQKNKKSTEVKSEVPKCPKCGSEMILRRNSKTGSNFWSCSQWPLCNGVRKFVDQKKLHEPADQDIDISV